MRTAALQIWVLLWASKQVLAKLGSIGWYPRVAFVGKGRNNENIAKVSLLCCLFLVFFGCFCFWGVSGSLLRV